MMRKIAAGAALLLVVFAAGAYAAVGGAPLPKNERPVLVTRLGGASPEVREQAQQAAKKRGGRLKLKERDENAQNGNGRTFMAKPQAADLAAGGYKTLIVMVGSYLEKNVDAAQDRTRLEQLLNQADTLHVKVVAIHVERPNRQDGTPTLDTARLDTLLKHASHIVAMKQGDAINARMTAYAKQNDIALSTLDSPRDLRQNADAQPRRRLQRK